MTIRLINETRKTDLTKRIQDVYQTRGMNNSVIPEPSLCIVDSLYDIALRSYLPRFVESGFKRPENMRKAEYDNLLNMVPTDLPLEDLLKITDDKFWNRKLLADYGVQPPRDVGALQFYFQNFAQLLLQGCVDKIPKLFDTDHTISDQFSAFNAKNIQIDILKLQVWPEYPYFDFVAQLNPKVLQLHFGEKPNNDDSNQQSIQQTQVPHTNQNQRTIRSKTLVEIATIGTDDKYESVFPFHNLYDQQALQQPVSPQNNVTQQLLDYSRPRTITDRDIAALQQIIQGSEQRPSQLTSLMIIDSGMNNQQSKALTVMLAKSKVTDLYLPGNCVTDISEIVKLIVRTEDRPGIQNLDLSRNYLQEDAAAQLMKALMQQNAITEKLLLSGNDLKDGFLLILNGILGASTKFQNKNLKVLDLSACNISPKQEHCEVIARTFEETGLRAVDLAGNDLSHLDLDELRQRAQYVGAHIYVTAYESQKAEELSLTQSTVKSQTHSQVTTQQQQKRE